jgi:hypothetical protein
MRSRILLVLGVALMVFPALASAQEPLRPVKRDTIPRRQQITPDAGLAEDSLGVVGDTTRGIDLEARREAIEGEGFPRRDDVFARLKELSGFMVFEYRGREVHLEVEDRNIGLFGEAQVNRGADVLTADTIRYRGNVRFMAAAGNIQLVGLDDKDVRSDSVLYYDLVSSKGTVFGAETQFMQGGTTWRVVGDVIPTSQDTVFASQGAFTSCDVELPHYRFQAGEIKLVNRDVIVAWPVVLYVGNVPIFWLPFFAQDIRPGRRSGILPPRFGINDIVQTDNNASRNVTDFGYYWAVNDFTDLQASVDWFSGNYTRINGTFRYRFLKKFIRGSIAYGQTFSETGKNLTLGFNHDQELGLNTTLRVSARYVQDTRTFQDQSFDPRLQTQTIDSDAGLNRRFSFGNVAVSARRRQFLTSERIEQTFPQVSLSFSPVTLFYAPRGQGGLFSNMTLTGSGSFRRNSTSEPLVTDRASTTGSLSSSLRLGQLSLSGSGNYDENRTTEEDSTGVELPSATVRRLNWNAGLDYQINLIGSTALRPRVSWTGGYFSSPDTEGEFKTVPAQLSVGATLSTDVFGFYPGFGAFSRIRHKLSPGFSWAYAPAVAVDADLGAIPGFPVDSIAARHTLNVTLNQTFEAKVKRRDAGPPGTGRASPDADRGRDALLAPPDSLAPQADSLAVEPDSLTPQPDLLSTVRDPGARADPRAATEPPRQRERETVVTLLAITTSALAFDFERAKQGEPALVSPTVSNNIRSDLLRGFTLNMTHRLFEGIGTDRKFNLSLQQIAMSFSLRSGQGFGDLVGLGSDGTPARRDPIPSREDLDARSGLREFYGEQRDDPFADGPSTGGPWSLNLRYSLVRPQTEGGRESQTIDGSLSLKPTPGWAVRWGTQYNFTSSEFGAQRISLDRDLHRWRASFEFSRAPNGNVIFSVGVVLTDAPELRGDYRQQTN